MARAAAVPAYINPETARAGELVEQVLSTQGQMHNQRGNFNTLWQSVSERVLPNYSDFTQEWAEGQRRTNKVFESTPVLANEHFCAAMESMLCPPSTLWHRLRTRDPRFWDDIEIQQWLDRVNNCLFRARYAPGSNFQSQVHESFAQLGAFGNGPFSIDDDVGYGLRYRSMHLAETFGIENASGIIDHVHREYQLTAEAAIDAERKGMFEKGSLPDAIRTAYDKNRTQRFTFIRAIWPDPDYREGSKFAKRFKAVQVAKEGRCLLKEGGYYTQPMLLPRYRVNAKETYGRGPGCDVLPDILMLNEMAKTNIRGRQRAAAPPIMLMDDGSLGSFDMRSDALNFSMLDNSGRPMAVPFQTGANFESTMEFMDQTRQLINRAFLVDIFSILEQPGREVTATEVLQRAQEKGQLLAPLIGRQQMEMFGPTIERELDVLDRAGQLPPPPDKLRKMGRIDIEVVYESEIQIAQRKTKALAISATLQQMAPLAEADPTAFKVLNIQRTARLIADSNGAPADILNTQEENDAQDDAQAQQQQLTNVAQIAGPASQAIKNIADAQRASGSPVPGNIPGIPG